MPPTSTRPSAMSTRPPPETVFHAAAGSAPLPAQKPRNRLRGIVDEIEG